MACATGRLRGGWQLSYKNRVLHALGGLFAIVVLAAVIYGPFVLIYFTSFAKY